MSVYLLIPPDGPPEPVRLDTLEQIQAVFPSGLFEGFSGLKKPLTSSLYLNDDRWYPGLGYNELATEISSLFPGDFIMGPVLVVGPPDEEGEAQDVPDEEMGLIYLIYVKLFTGSHAPPRNREKVAAAIASGDHGFDLFADLT